MQSSDLSVTVYGQVVQLPLVAIMDAIPILQQTLKQSVMGYVVICCGVRPNLFTGDMA